MKKEVDGTKTFSLKDLPTKIQTTKCHDDSSDTLSLRERTYRAWVENPHISAKKLCSKWKISYKKHGHTLRNYLSQFRCHYIFGLPQKAQKLPHKRIFVWSSVERSEFAEAEALKHGWKRASNRNRMLSFSGDRGTVHWYLGGLVRLYLRGAVQIARAKELFGRAFSWFSSADLCKFLDIPLKEELKQWVFEVGSPLPRFDIRSFEASHGLRFFSNGSNPKAVEVEETEPLYMAKYEQLLDRLGSKIDRLGSEVDGHLDLIEKWKEEAEVRRKPRLQPQYSYDASRYPMNQKQN